MAKRNSSRSVLNVGYSRRDLNDPRTGQRWRVEAEWALIDGRAEPVTLCLSTAVKSEAGATTFDPLKGDRHVKPIVADLVRQLPIGTILAEMRREAARDASFLTEHDDPDVRDAAQRYVEQVTGRHPGRLERAAAVYRAAFRRGENPTEAVALEFGVAQSTAAKTVMRARRAGLLGPARPGKAGEA